MRRFAPFSGLPGRFLVFLSGLTISRLGDALYTFAIPWISYDLTRSVGVMSSLYATGVLPIVLFGPLVGVFLDRMDRRKLMMTADAARAGLIALAPVLHLLGALQVWHLYVLSFLLAVLTMAFDVATSAVIPEMAADALMKANAAKQMVSQVGDMLGPALAGVAIAAFGGYNALWLDAVSFGATFLALLRMPPFARKAPSQDASGIFKQMAEGLRWLVHSPLNFTLSIQASIGNFGYSMVAAVLMYYLRSTLGLDAHQSGLNYSLLGLGGLVGSLSIVFLDRRYRRGVLFPSLLAFGTGGFLLMSLSPYWLAPGLGLAMVAACNVAWSILSISVRQQTVPSHMLGRVLSFSRVLTRLAMPAGALLAGWVTGSLSIQSLFLMAAAAKALEVLIALLSPMRRL